MKTKFRVWDNEKNKYFKPIYEAYKGNLEEILLSQSGELIMRTMIQSIHCPSIYPDRFETEFFIGHQDKNGKDIYKGDIYKYKSSEQGKQDQFYETKKVVQFYKGSFGFQEWNTDDDGRLKENLTHHATSDLYYIDFDIEIIGNIHEDKQLLK